MPSYRHRRRTFRRKSGKGYKRRMFRRFRKGRTVTKAYQGKLAKDVQYVKMVFLTRYSMTAASTNFGYTWRGNSLYDPDYTSSSPLDHQPNGFDQWATLYNKFTVLGSKCKVRLYNSDGGSPIKFALGAALTASPPDNAEGNPNTWGSVLTPSDGSKSFQTITRFMSTKKIFQVRDVIDNPAFDCTASADATKQWFWNLQMYNMDGLSNIAVNADVKITYYVRMKERKVLTYS